mmetsp:Transcript_28681/g.76631  ORF Transcript_28681/g.76631 Transcript_28681/m.76631 type:complete len:211 (+) Transcript_28681:106-738(+)
MTSDQPLTAPVEAPLRRNFGASKQCSGKRRSMTRSRVASSAEVSPTWTGRESSVGSGMITGRTPRRSLARSRVASSAEVPPTRTGREPSVCSRMIAACPPLVVNCCLRPWPSLHSGCARLHVLPAGSSSWARSQAKCCLQFPAFSDRVLFPARSKLWMRGPCAVSSSLTSAWLVSRSRSSPRPLTRPRPHTSSTPPAATSCASPSSWGSL